ALLRLDLLDRGGPTGLGSLERLRPDKDDGGLVENLQGGDLGAAEIGHTGREATALGADVHRVGDLPDAEAGREPSGHLAGVGGEAEEDQVRSALLDERSDRAGGGHPAGRVARRVMPAAALR